MPGDVACVVLIIELLPTQSDLKYCPAIESLFMIVAGVLDVAEDLLVGFL